MQSGKHHAAEQPDERYIELRYAEKYRGNGRGGDITLSSRKQARAWDISITPPNLLLVDTNTSNRTIQERKYDE